MATVKRLNALLPDEASQAEPAVQDAIGCPKSLRALWPDPLAGEWLEQYPQLFDADDLRCTKKQRDLHFWEWFAAVHLFEHDGLYSLVEKYIYGNHPVKRRRLLTVLSEDQLQTLWTIYRETHSEPPDLFVYVPGTRQFWFVEAKGPTDRLRPNQRAYHEAVVRELGVPVEVLRFTLTDR